MSHRFCLRVYYEDTDFAGIVYYANYLKFIERARTELLRELGIDQSRMRGEQGLVFAVRRLEADFIRPAKFNDWLCVETRILSFSGARLSLRQKVLRDTEPLFDATVMLACLSESGRPARLPAKIRSELATESLS